MGMYTWMNWLQRKPYILCKTTEPGLRHTNTQWHGGLYRSYSCPPNLRQMKRNFQCNFGPFFAFHWFSSHEHKTSTSCVSRFQGITNQHNCNSLHTVNLFQITSRYIKHVENMWQSWRITTCCLAWQSRLLPYHKLYKHCTNQIPLCTWRNICQKCKCTPHSTILNTIYMIFKYNVPPSQNVARISMTKEWYTRTCT